MATTGVSSIRKTGPQGFMALLSAAICEWLLIFLLFVDAAFSYLLTKFAEYCELQTPCLFCSRINPHFDKLRPEYYRSLLCKNHRDEISSLVSCQVHGNLADVREMCEECFTPFSMRSKLNSGSYRLLVGKLGLDIEGNSVQSLLLHRRFLPSPSGQRICSCCDKSWGAKPNAHKFLQLTPVGLGASKANVKPPLPRVPGRSRFSRRDSFKKLRNRFSAPGSPLPTGKSHCDPLSHVGYSELKFNSDSESEVPFSDDEDVLSAVEGKIDWKEKYDALKLARRRHKSQKHDVAFEKQSHEASANVSSLLDQHMQHDTSKIFSPHGLEELNWEQTHPEFSNIIPPKLISLHDVTQAPTASTDHYKPMESLPQESNLSMLDELILFKTTPQLNVMEIKEQQEVNSLDKENEILSKRPKNVTDFSNDGVTSMSEDFNSTDVSGGVDDGKEASHIFVEPPSVSKSPEVEDSKSVPQVSKQLSNATDFSNDGAPFIPEDINSINASVRVDEIKEGLHTVELPSVSGSLKVEDSKSFPQVFSPDQGEFQKVDASSSGGMYVQIVDSPERNDSSIEYLNGVSVSNMEGENATDRLKRQIEYDKKCMNDLYKELEEERNAAAIAANQAMAMITRLQEEKAALHMEALQYLRMMEEQAEYDMEALEKANDLLAEKEKEIQDLEVELELYKNNIQGESVDMDPCEETFSAKRESSRPLDSSTGQNGFSLRESSPAEISKMSISKDTSDKAESLETDLDKEKLYLVGWLKNLERRIHEVSFIEACTDACNGGHPEVRANRSDNQDDLPSEAKNQICSMKEVNGSPMQNGISETTGISASDSFTNLVKDCNDNCEESNHNRSDWKKLSISGGNISLATLENEIAYFKDRLKALETDCDFLKHASSALRNGNDGLVFIQEIVRQLQELRKIEFKR